MSDEDVQTRITAIEERLDELQDVVESCRKGMIGSKVAILVGSALFAANIVGFGGHSSLFVGLASFSAIIGGIVWLGANKTSREQALAAIESANAEWRDATDTIAMSTIGGQASRED
ncbi:MAG: hypothetical protein NVS2B5_30080 [Beijerinckiaceae bacterium]